MLSEALEEFIEENTGGTSEEHMATHGLDIFEVVETNTVILCVGEEFFGEYDSFEWANLAEDINFIIRERIA